MLGTVGLILLGILALVLVGIAVLDATRGTPVSRVSARGDDGAPAVDDPAFRCAIEAHTGVALRPGHAVSLLADGDGIFPPLWADIRAARRFVAVQMYYCAVGQVADALRDALVDRARAGVDVLFLHDAFGSSLPDEFLDSLREAGVEVARFRPFRLPTLHTVPHRAHVRAIVIDHAVGYTGGFGFDDKWLGDGHTAGAWRDTGVRFTGPAVAQLLATFAACWAEATGELIAGRRFWGPDESPGEAPAGPVGDPAVLAGVLHGTPTVGSTPAERLMALTVASARRTLWLTNAYFVPDDDFRRLVTDAARRGVDVRVLTAGEEIDVKTTLHAAHARYDELLSAGVRIFEYQPSMIHAKTMVVDGAWAMVGTMNLDNRSMAFNNECTLLALDAPLAAALEAMFARDLVRAREIDLATFRRRPWHVRPLEYAAHMISRIL